MGEPYMGGQNHQPCNKYVAISILMSKAMTQARSDLEMANVALEDLLLAELDNRTGIVEPIISRLTTSKSTLGVMMQTIIDLRNRMDEERYEDLPNLKTTDLITFGEQCAEAGLHRDSKSWQMVASTMKTCGFYAMLDIFEEHIKALRTETTELIGAMMACRKSVSDGRLTDILEFNGDGNFKVEFFKLYASWEEFYQIFQASSIISTELWYRFNNRPSLLGAGTPTMAVA
jgi:hypothetical protein